MTRQQLLFIASIITCYLFQAQGADKYTDENRPYEFGFTIDGEQHRHEEKDKNGIIKGEYGFITADGVYHVTVYATDEQGRFKILSMKNIRYRDYKGLSGTLNTARQGHSLQLPSPQPEIASQKSTSISAPVSKPAQEFETISIEPPANSCSHCSLPTTSTAAPEVPRPPINFASNLPNAPGQSNSFDAGRTQYSSTSNTVSVNNRNNFNVQSDQKQNPFNENQGSRPAPSAPVTQNNYYKQQNSQQHPNESIKPSGFSEATNIGQEPKVPGQQYPFGGQQIAPGGQQTAFGGQEVTTSGQLFAPVGEQIAPSSPQVVPNLFAPFAQQNTPGQPQITLGGQQFIPSEPQSTPGGQQFVSGGPQSVTGGQQFVPGGPQLVTSGQQIAPIGQQIAPGGQQYQGNGPQTSQFERTRSGKQYTETPNLSTPQNSRAEGVGVSQNNVRTSQKPMLAYAQMQIVDKKTDIHSKKPGEKDGLPPGLHEDDMLKLLYTFNYTLGFQAHFEEGYTNGEKRGYYYTTGRNGVRTRIDYVADENGFRPTLSQEVFDILSDDVPKANTEKEEKYGLKGYEFKWLYFPPDKNSQ